MKKLLFAITSLQLGGAERVLVDIVNRLKDEYDITIFTIYGNGEFSRQLDEKIHLCSYYEDSYEHASFLQKRLLNIILFFPFLWSFIYRRKLANKYDVEIAFLEGPVTWLLSSKAKKSVKKIAWIHNDLEKTYERGLRNSWKRFLNRHAYQKYQDLVFVSQDNRRIFERQYPTITAEKTVIYNYINIERIKKLAKEKVNLPYRKDLPVFCTVCRLTEQKGLHRLIKVHAQLIKAGYHHRIYIIGSGPLKEKLLDEIKKYKVLDTFILLGKKENPYPYMQAADYLLLASLYEGYGMVLVEAKILEKRILITDTAAREALIDYDNHLIMENSEEGIYQGIKQVLTTKKVTKAFPKYQNDDIINDIRKLIEK